MAEIYSGLSSDIRVLFLGDGKLILYLSVWIEGVGKTSIIMTFVTDTFPTEVPKLFISPVTISPDLYLIPNPVNTVLIDSSAVKSGES